MERGGPGSTGELLQSVVGALEEIREAAGAPTSAAFAAPPAPSLNHVLLQISALHKAFLALSDALTEEVEAAAAQRTLWDERLESVRRELSARLEVAQVLHADLQALADLDAGLHQRVSALEAGQQQQQQQPQGGPLAERVAQLEAQVASLEAQLEQQAAGGGEAVQREVTRLVNAQLEEHLALYEAERLPALVSAAAEQAAARWVAARLPAVLAEQAEAATGAAVEAVMRGAVASLHKACEAAAEAAAGAAADAAAVGMDVVQLAAWCQQVADAHANHEHRLARVEEAGLSRGGTRNGNGGTAQPTPPATPAPPSLQKQAAPSQQPGGGGAQLEQRVWQLEADAPRWQATLQEAVAGLQEQLAALSAQQESQAGTCSELVHSVLADVMALARHTKVLDSEVRGLQRAVSRTQQAVIDSSGAFAKALNLPSPSSGKHRGRMVLLRAAALMALALLAASARAGDLSASSRHLLQQAAAPQAQAEVAAVTPERGPLVNAFAIPYGGYANYFLSDNTTSGVVLFTLPGVRLPDGSGARFLVAFPAANSGAVAYFNATEGNSSALVMQLENGTLSSTVFNGSAGLTGTLTFDRNATLYRAIVSSIRTVRDYVEGPRIVRPIFAHSAFMSGPSVVLYRQYINGSGANALVFTPADDTTTLTLLPDSNFTISLAPGAKQARVNFTATVHWPREVPIVPADALVAPGAQQLTRLEELDQFAFLTYAEKFVAGSWRFLTYFGRDSLITLRLMMNKLSALAIEAPLSAALANLNTLPNYYQYDGADFVPVGTVCHEEVLADYASFTNILNYQSQLGDTLYCDYKMIDADFLLAPAAAIYLLELNQGAGRADAFLNATVQTNSGNRTRRELLADNARLVVNVSHPFAADPTVANLIHLRPAQPVGNWRDSNNGLGQGRIPFDVQFLVAGALRAIEGLATAGVLTDPGLAAEADSLAAAWEARVPPLFLVNIPLDQANQLVANYSGRLDVPGPGQLNSASGNVSFYALALYDDGTPVPIMHSDLSLAMVYSGGGLPADVLATVPTLLQEFPAGLLIPGVGIAVANPAYAGLSPNATQFYQNFTAGDYHGTVVWGWQQAMMVEGIERQLAFCAGAQPPAFCSDAALVGELQAALERLWSVITTARDVAFSEVWSWKWEASGYRVTSLAENAPLSLAGFATESNAIQLWSYSFLAVSNPWGNGTLLQHNT